MKNYIIIFLSITLLAGISSCVKEKFSEPAVTNTDPNLVANTTVAAVVALCKNTTPLQPVQITNSLILAAVVVADDKSGNFYKQLAIEDSTGGIMLMINGDDLYATYPQGRRLFISLQGLYVVNYEGTYEIVGSVDNGTYTGIASGNLSQYITPGKWGINISPIVVTLPQLTSNPYLYQSELIQVNSVQFATGYRGVTYANATYELSASMTITDCNENTDTIYNSGYANFASALTPTGNGTFIGIAGTYIDDNNAYSQLMIRDTTDLHLTGSLCP